MSALTATRAEIAKLIESDDLPAMSHVPSRPSAPFAMVLPGAPYVEAGDTFGSKLLRVEVWIILDSGRGENEAIGDELDRQIETAVNALEADDLRIENVSQPLEWQPANSATYLAVIITATAHINIPGREDA